jgi:uracil-DNA glycosylase family 4
MIDKKWCEGCPLEGVSKPSKPTGNKEARFMVVTNTPSSYNANEGRLLPKKASAIFAKAMNEVDYGRDDFLFVPQIRCPFNEEEYTTKEKTSIQKHCREHMLDDIYDYRPEVIIPLGAEASRQVLGKAVKITKIRGVAEYNGEHGATVLPMLNPSMVSMYPQHEPTFQADCNTLRRLDDSNFNVKKASQDLLGEYEFIDDLQFLVDEKPKVLYFDTETTNLEWFHEGKDGDVRNYDPKIHGKDYDPDAAILTMQFCTEEGKAYMLVWDHPEAPVPLRAKKRLTAQLRKLLCNPKTKVIGHNAKYDANFVLHTLGIRYKISGDTLTLAAVLDENSISKSQDNLVKKYVPEMAGYADHFNSTVDKSRMWTVPLDKLLDYGCGDVDSGLRMLNEMTYELEQDKKLLQHYNKVSIPGLNVFVSVEQRGLEVDEEALLAFEQLMEITVDQQEKALMAQVPRSIKRLHAEKGIKFSRADFVLDILFRHKDGFRLKPKVFTKTTAKLSADKRVPSTSSKDHLPYFFDECPFTSDFAQYVKDERLLSTNVRGFKKKYIKNGKVRPTYSLWTAVTGRSASENPNGQNFPKRGKNATAYRRIYVAPEGYYILEADLSQAELRIAADMANEPTMLRIYQNEGDIHVETALIVMGVTKEEFFKLDKAEQKLARFKAKAVNFGFIYGMGWRKFIGYAKTQYGVEFTEEEAQRIREGFFRKYSNLPHWHDRMREFAREHGYVRSYSGRIRHLPMIYSDEESIQSEAGRQAINSPVQEFGSSLGIMAMGRLNEEIDPKYLAPIAFVHDAIYCLVRKEYVEWGAKTLKWFMQSNPLEEWFGIKMKCPIVADVAFGENLGDTHEMPGLKLDKKYDFDALWEEDEESRLILPRQRIPPNEGRITGSIYSTY